MYSLIELVDSTALEIVNYSWQKSTSSMLVLQALYTKENGCIN